MKWWPWKFPIFRRGLPTKKDRSTVGLVFTPPENTPLPHAADKQDSPFVRRIMGTVEGDMLDPMTDDVVVLVTGVDLPVHERVFLIRRLYWDAALNVTTRGDIKGREICIFWYDDGTRREVVYHAIGDAVTTQ